ncbi:MAG TPA: PDZ domain-containing protein, partial [Thermoanaerobaculia bacterium]|nr:PDZ domain-containing protein [Thermoanaerobaculia bacterium]
ELRRVLPESPGAQAGLQSGDVLLALDGRPVKELTLQGVRRLLRETGKEYALSVFRQGQILQVHLKCRRLL